MKKKFNDNEDNEKNNKKQNYAVKCADPCIDLVAFGIDIRVWIPLCSQI